MGRKLNISTPTVINTELVPFNESFYIETDGQTEQWYYDNTGEYAPNRRVTPLTLTPHISVFDKDTKTSYTPLFYTMQWYVNEYDSKSGEYVERLITDQVDGDTVDYLIVGFTLRVKANVSHSRGVTIRCEATYIDPRDSGVTYAVQGQVLLTTNRDADVVFPDVDIISPSARAYNPLEDASSIFTFEGAVTNASDKGDNSIIAKYNMDGYGTEQILPDNSDGVVSCSPVMDITYPEGEDTDVQFTFRPTAAGERQGESGNAFVTGMRGNTVVWNQGYNFTPPVTVNLDNSSGTSVLIRGVLNATMRLTPNHKYYIASGYKGTANVAVYPANVSSVVLDISDTPLIIQVRSSVSSNTTTGLYYRVPAGVNCKSTICPRMFDLTLMFGSGKEPSTVAEFESWLAQNVGLRDYYPYNAGELIPVKTTAIRTTGFNQWDEEWEAGIYNSTTGEKQALSGAIRNKNLIDVFSGTEYFYNMGTAHTWRVLFYDSNKNYISSFSPGLTNKGGSFTTPSGCRFLAFYTGGTYGITYNHDICISLSSSRNGDYEAHWSNTASLDIASITGKLNGTGESVSVFPDGMKRAGNVYDEIKIEDGVVKAVKRVGSVDLGTLNWEKTGGGKVGIFGASLADIMHNRTRQNYCTPPYAASHYSPLWLEQVDDVITEKDGISGAPGIFIRDTSYDSYSTAAFKTAMSGIILYYELATPEEYVLDPIQGFANFVWYGIQDDNEVLIDTLPYYVSGQNTKTLTVDAMYGDNISVVLRAKNGTTSELSPSKDFANLVWRIPDIDSTVVSRHGQAVRSDTKEMLFETAINSNGTVLTDAVKKAHLLQNWKYRKSTTTTEKDAGYGLSTVIEAEELKNVKATSGPTANTLVFPYIYVKGPYEAVTLDDGTTPVTDSDGTTPIYARI